MNVLVLKTNIDSEQKLNSTNYIFNAIPQIERWSVDQEDIDKVLRIVASDEITESDIIELMGNMDIVCEELV